MGDDVDKEPYGRIFEPLAWRFLTVLYRRHHRHLGGISEMHPGMGMYDVRALFLPNGEPVVMINLGASLATKSSRPMSVKGQDLWPRLAAEGFDGLLDEVSGALGLPEDAGEPTAVWTYRFLGSFLQAAAFHRPRWRCVMEQHDSSGMAGGGPCGFVDLFPGARAAFEEWVGPRLYGTPGYFFWCLMRDDEATLLVDTTGRLWSREGQIALLPDVAKASAYRTWEMTTRAAGKWLE
jgi:hypothetical protein